MLTKEEVETQTGHILRQINMNPALCGYKYLKTAVALTYQDASKLYNMHKNLYPELAALYNKPPEHVEWSMRYAIDKTFYTGNYNALTELLKRKEKPSNTFFIAVLTETIKNQI